MRDKSNKCPQCNHTYTSVVHQRRCLGRHGAQIKRRRSASRATGGRRAAASVLSFSYAASGITASAAFFEDRGKDQAVQL